MKIRKYIIGVAVAALSAVGIVSVAPAAGATGGDVCTPLDAWTEIVEHPAEGSETIPNPDYVPATEGYWTTEVNPDYVPATEPQTVANGFVKWNWTGGKRGPQGTPPPAAGWHRVGVTSDSKGSQPDIIHLGNGKSSYFYFETVYKTIPGMPAQGDPTVDVWHEGTPAQGEPTISNPDYVPAWTESIEHAAVTCEPTPPAQPEPVIGSEERPATVDCTIPLDGTGKLIYEGRTSTAWPVWDEASGEYVYGEPEWTEWGTVRVEVIEHDIRCVETIEPKPELPEEPEVSETVALASTGGPNLWLGGALAALVTAGGAALIARGRRA